MGSRKGSAKAKRIAEFKAGLGGMDDVFAREDARKSKKAAEKDAALRRKACESKIAIPAKAMLKQLLLPVLSMARQGFIAISANIVMVGI